jgi:hypothetical protein
MGTKRKNLSSWRVTRIKGKGASDLGTFEAKEGGRSGREGGEVLGASNPRMMALGGVQRWALSSPLQKRNRRAKRNPGGDVMASVTVHVVQAFEYGVPIIH